MPNSFCIAMFYNNYITYRYFLFGFWTMGHPLQIIRVKKVTGNLNFLWLINTPYSKMLAIIGPVYREVEDFGRWGNPLRWDNPPVHVISHFNLNQEPISWNEQLPRRFHGPVSFQNCFGANLEYPLSPTNQSAKPTDLKKIIFAFSVNDATFSFLLLSIYFECVHSVVDIPFSREKLPENMSINKPVRKNAVT